TNNTTSADQLKIDVGGYNSLLGKSYGELAAQSRSQHKTQGFGSASQRGPELEYFALLAGAPAKTDLLDDIDISWNRVNNGKMIGELISKINSNFDMIDPASSVPDLLKLQSLINKIDDGPLKTHKLKEVDDLIMACAGIWFEMTSLDPEVSTADSIRIKIQAISLMPDALKMPVSISERRSGMSEKLLSENLLTIQTKIGPGLLTQPYWLTFNRTQGLYNSGPEAMDRPESEPIKAQFEVKIGNHLLEISRNVLYKFADPVKGEVYQPLIISPPVIVSPVQKMLFSGNNNSSQIRVKVTAKKDLVKGSVRLQGSDPLIIPDAAQPFELKKKGDVTYVDFQVLPAKNSQPNTLSEIRVSADVDGKTYSYDEAKISYDHLPVISYFPFADFKYLNADIKTSGKRIAYISGAGDRIAESLKLVGYSVDMLTNNNLLTRDLSVYDAIIAGVRLYNVNADVSGFNSRIMEYVKNGGTYLVQYNVNNGLKINEIGPYPFKISNTRVTDESAHVRILNSGHPVLNYPNKITGEDFNHWVQERGLYFATGFESNYQAIFSMHDPGEQESNGALIVSDYGKGRFVYTSLSFFRQLPAGVPGAYRLFVNLIAKRKH
ncbi:MAG TPA: LmbE family protein, partial [Sphingobacteriaceae bacterium]